MYTISLTNRYNPYTYTKRLESAIAADEYVTEILRHRETWQTVTINHDGKNINDLDLRFAAVAERRATA